MVEYEEETRFHQALTYDHSGAIGTGAPAALPPDQPLRQPAPLFEKLDERVVDEYARLQGKAKSPESRFRDSGAGVLASRLL